MARKRMVDPSIWTDDGMGSLSARAQLLFIGLFSNADDEGRLKGSPQAIRLILPTIYSDLSESEVRSDLDAVLGAMTHLTRYQVDGRDYLEFANYTRWQRIDRPTPSAIPTRLDGRLSEPGGHSNPFHESSTNDPGPIEQMVASIVEVSLVEVSLVEESGKEESAPRPRRAPRHREAITAEQIDRLAVEFAPLLGGEQSVRDRVDGALNHIAVEKAKSEYLYVRNWLRNDADKIRGRANGTASRIAPTRPGEDAAGLEALAKY